MNIESLQSNITKLAFELPGQVYRSPLPFGVFDSENKVFDLWKDAQIDEVYSLIQPKEWTQKAWQDPRPMILEAGMMIKNYPIMDFWVPDDHVTFTKIVAMALNSAKSGKNIIVHCNAGWGRTGLFLTEMAISHFGFGVDEAVKWVRQFVPPAVENEDQYQFLVDLHNNTTN